MNEGVFCDSKKNVFLKICSSSQQAEREVYGALAFASIVSVPKIQQVDSKTLLLSAVSGQMANQKDGLVFANYFQKLSKAHGQETTPGKFSILAEIRKLEMIRANSPSILLLLEEIKMSLKKSRFVPVHGDLQMQNVFIEGGQMTLIDFEHFCFAPIELEIVNSLFFADRNCLPINVLIPTLVKKKIFNINQIVQMLIYYSIKQLVFERSLKECEFRLNRGTEQLFTILKKRADLKKIKLETGPRQFGFVSSCLG